MPRCIFQQMRWGLPRFQVGVRHPPTSDLPSPTGSVLVSGFSVLSLSHSLTHTTSFSRSLSLPLSLSFSYTHTQPLSPADAVPGRGAPPPDQRPPQPCREVWLEAGLGRSLVGGGRVGENAGRWVAQTPNNDRPRPAESVGFQVQGFGFRAQSSGFKVG